MDELKMTQEEFEILDRILSGRLHKRERLEVIALIDKEGFSRRPEPLVRGMEIDVEAFAKEMFEVCVYPGLEKWEEQTNHIKTRWRTNAEIIRDNAHVWLKEKDTK